MALRTALRTIRVGPLVVDIHEPAGVSRLTLLYSHGFGSERNGRKVLALGAALNAVGATLISPDLQGHGESDGAFGSITVGRSIEDLLRCTELPEFKDAPRRMLGGSSFGALTALWTAVENPKLAERLFLIAPAFRFIERHTEELSDEDRARWQAGEAIRVEREWFTVDLEPAIYEETETRPVAELARRLTQPALIIHGKHDESVPLEEVLNFLRDCETPGLEFFVIGDGDHRLTEHKELLAKELIRFAGLDFGG